MKCPNCQAENDASALYCKECGTRLDQQQAIKKAASTTALFGRKAREARAAQVVDPGVLISNKAYNGVIIGVLLWGLILNVLLCQVVGNALEKVNVWVLLIGYLALAFGGITIASRATTIGMSLLGFHMVVIPFGVVISTLVAHYSKIDPTIVRDAFLYTALISVGMLVIAFIRPQLFEKLGGMLIGALLGVMLCEVVLMLFHVQQGITNWVVAGIFSLYIGYDVYRSQQYPKTAVNAVSSALDIYMDIANLFIRILEITGESKKKD